MAAEGGRDLARRAGSEKATTTKCTKITKKAGCGREWLQSSMICAVDEREPLHCNLSFLFVTFVYFVVVIPVCPVRGSPGPAHGRSRDRLAAASARGWGGGLLTMRVPGQMPGWR
jgi:hypothetical protein